MYPLMQGWDSVMIVSDVELGGTDQTFNNLVGRDLQESEGQPPQIVLIMPILVGTDGVQKMSKSLGNYIGVAEPPSEQFGKAMSIPDNLMDNWFRMITPLPDDRIRSLINPSVTHPRAARRFWAAPSSSNTTTPPKPRKPPKISANASPNTRSSPTPKPKPSPPPP